MKIVDNCEKALNLLKFYCEIRPTLNDVDKIDFDTVITENINHKIGAESVRDIYEIYVIAFCTCIRNKDYIPYCMLDMIEIMEQYRQTAERNDKYV